MYIPATYGTFPTAAVFSPGYDVTTLRTVHDTILYLIVLLDPYQGCRRTSLPSSSWGLELGALLEVPQLDPIAACAKD
jgi:hypothetical protein